MLAIKCEGEVQIVMKYCQSVSTEAIRVDAIRADSMGEFALSSNKSP